MLAFNRSTLSLYYKIKSHIKCPCGTPIWIEKPNPRTGLITVHCTVCQRPMTNGQLDKGLRTYSESFNTKLNPHPGENCD